MELPLPTRQRTLVTIPQSRSDVNSQIESGEGFALPSGGAFQSLIHALSRLYNNRDAGSLIGVHI